MRCLDDIHDPKPRAMWARLVLLLLAPLLGGCMKPNPLIYEQELGDEASESESGDGDETSDSEPGDGDTGDDDTGEGETDDGETSDSDSFLDLGGSEGNGCAPIEGFEPACGACLAESCCDLALECAAVDECRCLAECLLGGGNNGICKNTCGAKPGEVPELQPLTACVSDLCSDSC